ncbi:hypothetical protein Pmani_026240 [Petrolisthes manimaculis]|uniref:PWWP domain-containing protein n=1 Tax=Petrolisthes manimaculis TaxID=1843537 RepID=A0AAE1P6A7_9EUCA|nr:hypothetical protein Pmani_026240 [Petrolisthes manimaculis]
MADTYKLVDLQLLVWAKMKGFSPWPAGKVIPARENVKKPSKKYCHFIYVFGSENYTWKSYSRIRTNKPVIFTVLFTSSVSLVPLQGLKLIKMCREEETRQEERRGQYKTGEHKEE